MWGRVALRVLILLGITQAASARDRWVHLRSDHFEMFTLTDESAGHDALVFVEQVRRAFTEILGVQLPESRPVTIIAFRDNEGFAPYRPQESVVGYTIYQSLRDYIVMQDLNPEHYQIAVHEYTHVIISQAGMKLPLWLNEGFAEVFATMKPVGRRIIVGSILPGRLQAAQTGLIDLNEVLSADQQSPLYHENDRVGIFYAESWALLHMLKFSETYSPQFDRVLEAIGRGESSQQALQSVYGKSLAQIQSDLANYVRGARFREGVIHAKLEKTGTDPKRVADDPLAIDVALASIQARGPGRHEAVIKLEELAQANPGKPSPNEALAWIQLAGSQPESAIVPFRRALAAGTGDANLCFQYAVKLRATLPDADYVAALRRAAEIDPGYIQAQKRLAAHAFNSRDYAEAVTRLHLIRKLERADACMYYRALSYAAFQIGNEAEAKSAAARAQQYAVTAEDKRAADEMAAYVTSGKRATGFNGAALPEQ